jgi:hypothetical protein
MPDPDAVWFVASKATSLRARSCIDAEGAFIVGDGRSERALTFHLRFPEARWAKLLGVLSMTGANRLQQWRPTLRSRVPHHIVRYSFLRPAILRFRKTAKADRRAGSDAHRNRWDSSAGMSLFLSDS